MKTPQNNFSRQNFSVENNLLDNMICNKKNKNFRMIFSHLIQAKIVAKNLKMAAEDQERVAAEERKKVKITP